MRKCITGIVTLLFFCTSVVAGTITGKVTATGAKTPADAVIYIDKIPGKIFAPPKEHVKMDQIKFVFTPHILPILVGTTVDFLNSDDVLHNVFSPDKVADKFNLGTWPKGQVRSYTFKQEGSAVMLCNVHPEMEAYVVVVPTPYSAVSDKAGNYRIDNVPSGTYTLKIWHEKLKGTPQSVTVPESGSVTTDFQIKR
jgi:plastocyanin